MSRSCNSFISDLELNPELHFPEENKFIGKFLRMHQNNITLPGEYRIFKGRGMASTLGLQNQ